LYFFVVFWWTIFIYPVCDLLLVIMSDELRTIQPEDLFKFKFICEAKLSPDGRNIAYVVTSVDPEEMEEVSSIWLYSLDSGSSRRFTFGGRDSSPEWSPDGRNIAFLSNRSDKTQVFIIPSGGGEAKQLTSLKQGVGGGPKWSPDGRMIAFTAPRERDEGEEDPEKPFRVSRNIYRFDKMGYLKNAIQDIYVSPVEGEGLEQLTDDDCNNTLMEWSPDSKEILYTTSMFPDSHRIRPSLRVVNLDKGVDIIVEEWGTALSANWLPEGEGIVFIGGPLDVPIGTQNNLWVIDRDGGEPQCRTRELGFQVGGGLQPDMPVVAGYPKILLTDEGKSSLVQVQKGGSVQIYRVSLEGSESWEPITTENRSCSPVDLKGDKLLFLGCDINHPPDLFITNMDDSGEEQVTKINEEILGDLDQPTLKHMIFPGEDDTEVEGWILKPPRGEPPYPTVLYIHGGPHSAFGNTFSFDFQMLVGAGYAVLFTNQRGSTGYGDEFSTRIIGDWGNHDYKDLMAGVDAAIEKGIADPERLGCCGLSGGGNLSCWIIGQTNRFKAAVPENPVTNWVSFYGVSDIGPYFAVKELGGRPHEIPEIYRKCSPITYAHKCRTPTLLIQGEQDHRCPPEQSEQFYSVLKANNCTVEMLRLPNSSHTGSINGKPTTRNEQNKALLDWMNKYVIGDYNKT
jgi:dipeptidyl aminopeptidase/acylaminoacyl peptidase